MILAYSKNLIIHSAITHFCSEMNVESVYCFSNRIKFLTAATLLSNAWVVLDTVTPEKYDIIWLHGKLVSKVAEKNIYYLVRPVELHNIYSVHLNTLSTIQNVVELLRMSRMDELSSRHLTLAESLHRKINSVLSPSYIDLIRHEKLGLPGRGLYIQKYGNKVYLNRRYQIKKKLNLQTLQEYYYLIFMLNNENGER